MTRDDIHKLQAGDELEFPNGKRGQVRSIDNSEQIITFTMSGGDTVLLPPPFNELPEEKKNQKTIIVCKWEDAFVVTPHKGLL